jgi:hypothetical protein
LDADPIQNEALRDSSERERQWSIVIQARQGKRTDK